MNTLELLSHDWNANPYVIGSLVIAAALYARAVGWRGRAGCFVAALALVALAFLSPLNLLATRVLFSAHMAQHLVLLLLVPALLLLSLPEVTARRELWPPLRSDVAGLAEAGISPHREQRPPRCRRTRARPSTLAIVGWVFGVGSMWFWHVPQLCNAAAANPGVHVAQTVSLLAMGAGFWWPILAPVTTDRLIPGHGIIYLFTACLACTGLGILLTLSGVDVCPILQEPGRVPTVWRALREQYTAQRDQQIGGLLMWLPMCLVYVAAIVLELARWLGEPAPRLTSSPQHLT
jgi:cytochrome c oxidase assembly factor CtaG